MDSDRKKLIHDERFKDEPANNTHTNNSEYSILESNNQ